MSNGSLSLWDVSGGSLIRTLSGLHEFPIADVAFVERNPSWLVSVDLDGHCVRWDLDSNPLRYHQAHCAPNWDDSSYVGKELASPRLSSDGCYVGFPIYTYVEPEAYVGADAQSGGLNSGSERSPPPMPKLYCIVFVFETHAIPHDPSYRVDPFLVLPVRIDEHWVGAERLVDLILFSRLSSCLLLTVYELAKGYLVLWPNVGKKDVSSYRLHGTRGRFSQDDQFVVTWHCMLASGEQYPDDNCYVWDLGKLQGVVIDENKSMWNHPYLEGIQPMILSDPNEGVVHTCDFVRLKDHLGLVSCCVCEELTVIIWDLSSETPLHVLRTDIRSDEVSPGMMRSKVRSVHQLDRIHGIKCMTASRNGQWVGVYSSCRRRGIVWNASEGVEVLRIELPEEKVAEASGMDFCFSTTATRMLMVGRSRMLLWSPSVLRGFNPADLPLYKLSGSDDEIGIGESVCKFSADGSVVGLMRFNSECMNLWRFHPQKRFSLTRPAEPQDYFGTGRQTGATHFQVEAAKNRFCQFAASQDGLRVVTCMGDMAVLLWDLGDVTQCRCIATLTSYYFPALDVCFSVDTNRRAMVVVCQDQGILVWINVQGASIVHREVAGGNRSCKFSTDGKTAAVMPNLYHVVVWDIIARKQIRTLDYSIPILCAPNNQFCPQLSPNADFCLVGFDADHAPVLATQDTTLEQLGESIWYPETFMISCDGKWALMSGRVDEDTDDILMEEHQLPDFTPVMVFDFASTGRLDDRQFPMIDFREDTTETIERHASRQTSFLENKQTWKIVDLREQFTSKQMRLPYELRASKFVALSSDGSKCAALSACNQLIVWGTHFTYKNIIQQRRELMDSRMPPSREQIYAKLNEHGPSLVNHPYERGMNLTMECVALRRHAMLKHIINWSLDTGVELSFQGRITPAVQSADDEITPNAIDLAVDLRSQETIEVRKQLLTIRMDLFQVLVYAMMDGATSVTTFAQIMERSLVRLSYKYPTLVLHLFKSDKLMKSLGVVNISEGYLRHSNDHLGVVTDKRLVASEAYVQNLWSSNETKTMKNQPLKSHVSVQAEAKV